MNYFLNKYFLSNSHGRCLWCGFVHVKMYTISCHANHTPSFGSCPYHTTLSTNGFVLWPCRVHGWLDHPKSTGSKNTFHRPGHTRISYPLVWWSGVAALEGGSGVEKRAYLCPVHFSRFSWPLSPVSTPQSPLPFHSLQLLACCCYSLSLSLLLLKKKKEKKDTAQSSRHVLQNITSSTCRALDFMPLLFWFSRHFLCFSFGT